jgi:hypothetical protein
LSFEHGLVSVIIPVYNRPVLLRDAVASALEQDHRQIEVIVVDDGSTDSTPESITDLQATYGNKLRTVRIGNSGPGAAREAGRTIAEGEFIQYLDSDDLLLPAKFSGQVALLNQNPDCGIAYGKTAFQIMGEDLQYIAYKGTGERRNSLFPSMLAGRWWSTSTPLFRRELCDLTGPWLSLSNEEDWEYDCRVAKTGVRMVYLDEFVSVTRSHDEGHACDDGTTNPVKLHDRCLARVEIMHHAVEAGVPVEHPAFRRFLRGSFLVARQAAAQGVPVNRQLITEIIDLNPRNSVRVFRRLSQVLGDVRAAKAAAFLYGFWQPGNRA